MNNNITAEKIASGLGGKGSGSQFRAPCPAHLGSGLNLAISDGPNGKVLLKCHSNNCPQEAIVSALKARGLWPTPKSLSERKTEYIYFDLNKKPALKVTRVDRPEGKSFHQSHVENGTWIKGGFKGEVN